MTRGRCGGTKAAGLGDRTGGGGAAELCTLIAREQGGTGKGTWPSFTSLQDTPGRSCKAGYGKVTASPEVICSVGGAEVTRMQRRQEKVRREDAESQHHIEGGWTHSRCPASEYKRRGATQLKLLLHILNSSVIEPDAGCISSASGA